MTALPTILGWEHLAACRSSDPNLFFPTRGDSPEAARAKAICWECPVRQECLHYAVDAREPLGIWGGLDHSEREVLLGKRINGRAAFTHGGRQHGTESGYSGGCRLACCRDAHAAYTHGRRVAR